MSSVLYLVAAREAEACEAEVLSTVIVWLPSVPGFETSNMIPDHLVVEFPPVKVYEVPGLAPSNRRAELNTTFVVFPCVSNATNEPSPTAEMVEEGPAASMKTPGNFPCVGG